MGGTQSYENIHREIQRDNYIPLCEYIRNNKDKINDHDDNGETLLTYMCKFENVRGSHGILEISMIIGDKSGNADINVKNSSGETALEILSNHKGITHTTLIYANYLLENGGDPVYNKTYYQNVMISFLINKVSFIDNGDTKINYYSSYKRLLKNLIDNGSDINHKYDGSFTTLMRYVILNNYEMVKILLELGADPNIQTNIGDTALHYLKKYDIEMINLLIEHGANPHIKNEDGIDVATDIGEKFKNINITF